MTDPAPLREQIAGAMIQVFAPDRMLLKPEELRIIDELVTAVLAVIQRPDPAAGPTVAEAATQDRAHWADKYAGEGQ